MEITYDYYRIFYYAAKYKSFSKAAEILMSNQPNITHFMNNLENQLGCRLFIRSNRGVTLTREGEKLYKHVTIAYQHFQLAELEWRMIKVCSGIITVWWREIADIFADLTGNRQNLKSISGYPHPPFQSFYAGDDSGSKRWSG